jgi:hypothetical protein
VPTRLSARSPGRRLHADAMLMLGTRPWMEGVFYRMDAIATHIVCVVL